MSKIESFKRICSEMEQRKQNLDKEVDKYSVMNENLRTYGAYVPSENNVINSNNNVPQNRSIKYVTKDRATFYTSAITKALPEAKQIADKFHLIKNLSDAIFEEMCNNQLNPSAMFRRLKEQGFKRCIKSFTSWFNSRFPEYKFKLNKDYTHSTKCSMPEYIYLRIKNFHFYY